MGKWRKRGGGNRKWGKAARREKQQRNINAKTAADNEFYKQMVHRFQNQPLRQKQDASIFGSQGPTGINFDAYCKIKVERSGREADEAKTITMFSDLAEKLPNFLKNNIVRMRYKKPTPIQAHSIPVALSGRDVMCCAQTGSGKTCAFLLPVISELTQAGRNHAERFTGITSCPEVVVLAPTRELASQIHVEALKLTYSSQIISVVVYGGVSARDQLQGLARGADIVVATPGRLQDFFNREIIVSFSKTRFLILDEADRMLDMGFEPQIRGLVQRSDMLGPGQRRTLMFSATFPREIQHLASSFMDDYVWIAVGRVGSTLAAIKQVLLLAPDRKWEKLDLLCNVIKQGQRTLVFVRTKKNARWVSKELRKSHSSSAEIHGDRTQEQREQALRRFRSGEIQVLVATNVAARGLDIAGVDHVVNFDLATNKDEFDSYVHRIGRTGRAGHKGLATSFYVPGFSRSGCGKVADDLLRVLRETDQDIPQWFLELPEVTRSNNRQFPSNKRKELAPQKSSNKRQELAPQKRPLSPTRVDIHSRPSKLSKTSTSKKLGNKGKPYGRCSVCRIDFASAYHMQFHMKGKQHSKNSGKPTAKSANPGLKTSTVEKKGLGSCDLCSVNFESASQKESHIKGNRHTKALKKAGKAPGGIGEAAVEVATECNICQVKYASRFYQLAHLRSKSHKEKAEQLAKKQPEDTNGYASLKSQVEALLAENAAMKTERDELLQHLENEQALRRSLEARR